MTAAHRYALRHTVSYALVFCFGVLACLLAQAVLS